MKDLRKILKLQAPYSLFDNKGNEIYWENSDGDIKDNRPKEVKEMTVAEIEKALGYTVKVVK